MRILVSIFVVAVAFTCVQSYDDQSTLVFRQKQSSGGDDALLVVQWEENDDEISTECGYYTNRGQINKLLNSSNITKVRTISKEYMQKLLSDCDSVSYPEADEGREETTSTTSASIAMAADSETTTAGYDGIPVIFPGTKWCGAGDRAKDYDDLGLHQDTDRCCRAHDLCNDTLAPGESRNNLTNDSKFTKLSCQCDNDFYNCLDRVNTLTSNTIGNMYFNVLRRECYKADYPNTKKCLKYKTIFKIKCVEYEKNKKAPKVYQWVRAKKYRKLPFPGPLTVTLPF